MRTNYSIKNSITSVMCNVVAMLIGFIAQAIFIRILGAEYLGLNGLFTNVLTMLSIFELGIGNAIVYNLYKPIANNNVEEIKSLMLFYKRSYNVIALLMFIVGILITPFIGIIVGTISININIYIVYILFLLSTVTSYTLAYKRNLIIAFQRNYIINIVHMCYLIALYVSQLLFLFITKNYYLYLIIKIVCQLLENLVLNFIANKLYPYLSDKNVNPLDKQIEKDIFTKVKALLLHKIAGILVKGTDNIIISYFFGVITVGLYSNYNIIINAVVTLFNQVIVSSTASVGNLLVTENEEKKYNAFKKIRFLNFWIACFSAVSIFVIIQPFVVIWIGKEYLLTLSVLSVIVFEYFQRVMRGTYATFKDSSGIWVEDKYVPLLEATINIVFSIICLKVFGLAGVFMGTILSSLCLWCYSYPKYVYKKLFNRSYFDYTKETLSYTLLFILIAIITYGLSLTFALNNYFLQVLMNTIICLIIPNLIMYLIFRKTDNFTYFLQLSKKILTKFLKLKND